MVLSIDIIHSVGKSQIDPWESAVVKGMDLLRTILQVSTKKKIC
jgi:hypothetical protein